MPRTEEEYIKIANDLKTYLNKLKKGGWPKDEIISKNVQKAGKMIGIILNKNASYIERDAAVTAASNAVKDIEDRLKVLQPLTERKYSGPPLWSLKRLGKFLKREEAQTEEKVEKKIVKREEKVEKSRAKEFAVALAKGFSKLKEHKKSIGWIIGLIIFIFVAWFLVDVFFGFIQTPFGKLISQTLNQYVPIEKIKTDVGNQFCMLKCYATSITSVASWTAAGGLDKYCQLNCKITAQAEVLGCTNCYTLSSSLEEPTPVPFSIDTIRITIDATEGKKYSWGIGGTQVIVPIPPAQSPIVRILSNDITDIKFNEDYLCKSGTFKNECHLNSPVGPNDVPIKISADFTVPCKSSAQYDVWFTYVYNVSGVSFIKFKNKNYKSEIITPKPTTSPGPLKVNVEPYTDVYTSDVSEVRIAISLVNQGYSTSQIKVDKIVLDQIAPSGYSNFTDINCIEVDVKPVGGGTYELLGSRAVYPGQENAVNFHCSLTVPQDIKKLEQSAYYTIIVTANYTYNYKIVGDTVFPDPRYSCKITTRNWKMMPCLDESGKPTNETMGCKNFDVANWNTYDFDDTIWYKISLPDTKWGCEYCDRFYRLDNFVWDGSKEVWLNVSSDDGARCWVINKNGVNRVDEDCKFDINEERECGMGTGKCKRDPLLGCKCEKKPDYSCRIDKYLAKSEGGKINYNIIACQVRNQKGESGFDVTS
jgi:hypothetical protein